MKHMADKAKNRAYFGGMPTSIDIKKLLDHWPISEMKVHDIFLHSEIEEIIQTPKKSNRYQTVTTRWRKRVRSDTQKIVIGPMPDGTGFWVLSESEKHELSRCRLRESFRKARETLIVNAITDRKQLTAEEQGEYDHTQKMGAAMRAIAQVKRDQQLPSI